MVSVSNAISNFDDYTKKVIGEKLIVELMSMYELFEKLSKYNHEYKNNEFKKLKEGFQNLNLKYEFFKIRNKLGAHKDVYQNFRKYILFWNNINEESIKKYIYLMRDHLSECLSAYYLDESILYFTKIDVPEVISATNEGEYINFSENSNN